MKEYTKEQRESDEKELDMLKSRTTNFPEGQLITPEWLEITQKIWAKREEITQREREAREWDKQDKFMEEIQNKPLIGSPEYEIWVTKIRAEHKVRLDGLLMRLRYWINSLNSLYNVSPGGVEPFTKCAEKLTQFWATVAGGEPEYIASYLNEMILRLQSEKLRIENNGK